MEDLREYTEFKKDIMLCLKQSISKYHFIINDKLSEIEDPDIVIENKKFIVQLSFMSFFPRIIIDFNIFNKEREKINFLEIQKITGITESDILGLKNIIKYKKTDTLIKKQLRELNQLWLTYYEPLFNE